MNLHALLFTFEQVRVVVAVLVTPPVNDQRAVRSCHAWARNPPEPLVTTVFALTDCGDDGVLEEMDDVRARLAAVEPSAVLAAA